MAKLSPINHSDKKAAKVLFSFPDLWEVEYAQFAFNEVRDGTHDSPKESSSGVPLVTSKNLKNGSIDFSNTKVISYKDHEEISKRSAVGEGDLLFSMIGTIGNVAQVGADVHFSVKNVGLFRRNDFLLEPRFAYHWLTSYPYLKYLDALKRGGNQKFVSLGVLRESPVPIPSLAEQKVIAKKLDKLLAKVDNIKARLDVVPDTLKRFRQSVLAAAVSGKLTEEWRGSTDYNVSSYPEAWTLKGLSDVGELGRGKSKHRPRNDPKLFGSEYPFIQTGEVANSSGMITSASKFYSEFGLKQSKLFPKGTLCITIAANIADTSVLGIDACFPDSVVGFTPDSASVDVLFVKYLIDVNKANLEAFAPATAQKNINLKVLNEMRLPFPSLKEQTEIVRRVENLFAYADKVEAEVNAAQERVNKLTQSILAKAFRGELTAKWREQNPELISGENSAEALLEKIKAEREKLKPTKKRKAK